MRWMRAWTTFCLALCVGLGLGAVERPNFVVIIGDDIGWNDFGVYGHPAVKTPNIDALAEEGMRFDAAFLTTSSCSPSRSSIMTGRYPHNTGAAELHMPLPEEQIIFPEKLKEAGYYTAAAGKWHLGNAARRGFDRIEGTGNSSGSGHWLEVARERPMDRPFFLWLAAIDAHRGFDEETIEEPHRPEDVVVPPFLPDTEATRRDLALYYDEVSRFDQYTGLVLEELERQGARDNTVVIVMSDNGRPFPRCKTMLYDSGVKTPFVVSWPAKVAGGQESDSLVSSIDLAPTLLELAGVEAGPSFEGVSFAPLLESPGASTRDAVFAEHNWHDYRAFERSVRTKNFLYIRNWLPHLPGTPPADASRSPTFAEMKRLAYQFELQGPQWNPLVTPRPSEELYDVKADPFQLRNLAQEPAFSEALEAMRKRQEAWAEETGDAFPDELTPDRFHRITGKRLAEPESEDG